MSLETVEPGGSPAPAVREAARTSPIRSRFSGRIGYVSATLFLVVTGCVGGTTAGAPAGGVWSGALLAWGIQAGSFWKLWPVLRSGRSAVRPWVGGMAARMAGLAGVVGGAFVTPIPGKAAAAAYVAAILPLLWLEGAWLLRASRAPGWGECAREEPSTESAGSAQRVPERAPGQ